MNSRDFCTIVDLEGRRTCASEGRAWASSWNLVFRHSRRALSTALWLARLSAEFVDFFAAFANEGI